MRVVPTAERPPSPPDDDDREQGVRVPAEYRLDQNYPNPFNPSTTISYALPEKSRVELAVFNLLGERISTLVSGEQDAGFRSVDFGPGANPGVPLPSGMYFCRLTATSVPGADRTFVRTRKMILLK